MKKVLTLLAGSWLACAVQAQVNTFPHFTDFDSEATCGTSCTGSCNPAGHWKNADQYAFPQAGTDWLAYNSSTPSSSTGPDFDHTTGVAGAGRYMYTETSGCTNTTAHLVSGIYDFSASAAPRISFWWHMYGATMGVMHLDIDTSGLGNWVNDVVPAWTANVNQWQFSDYSIAQLAGRPSTRIRLRMVTGTSFTSDAAVDDITVYVPQPNDITVNAVNAGGGCGNSPCTPVFLELVNSGTDTINAGTQIPVSFMIDSVTVTDTFTLTADLLSDDTLTYMFVNGCADLSGPNTVAITAWSSWSSDLTIGNDTTAATTIGIPVISTFPYYEDFETGQNGWTINNGPVGTWAFGTPAKTTINSAASGSNAFVTGGLGTGTYLNGDNSYVEGPCFDFTNVCDPVVSLNVWWNAEFSWDGMNIFTSIDGGTTWQLVGNMGDQVNWYTDNSVAGAPGGSQIAWSGRSSTSNGSGGWVNARHHLTGCGNLPNVKVRIYFGTDGSVTDDGCAFDDIHIYDGVDLGSDVTVCSPSTVVLNANGGAPNTVTYLWNDNSTAATLTAATTGWYWVDVTNGSCVKRDSVYVVVIDANSIVSLGPDTTICSAGTLDAGYWPGASYTWSNGDSLQTTMTAAGGVYSVSVNAGCATLADTVAITLDPAMINLAAAVTSCSPVVLDGDSSNVSWNWSSGGTAQMETISTSGVYTVDVMNASGCSATDTIAVTINTPPAVTVAGMNAICAGSSSLLMASGADLYQWVNGPAGDMFTVMPTADTAYWVVGTDSITGCTDSASFMITVLQATSLTQSVNVCFGGSYTIGVNTYTANGTYMDTLVNAAGCDSVVTTMLMVDTLISSYQSFAGCSGFTITVGANTYSQTGTYTDTLTAINGCDSIVTTDLQIAAPLTSSQSFTICQGGSVTVGNSTYTTSGTYMDTVSTMNGCDSVITTVLSVTTVNVATTVTGNGAQLNAVNGNATSYQWIDCATNQPIANATGSSYVATANGNYAVIITDNNCTDTSACIAVTNVGIEDAQATALFNVFPNPASASVTITTSVPTEIVIYNTLGEVVMAQGVQNTVVIDLTSFEGGVYFIRTTEGKIVRLVKE